MRLIYGPKSAKLCAPPEVLQKLLRDAIRGAEWDNARVKGNSTEAGRASMARIILYESNLTDFETQEEARILELQGRGI